METIWSKNGATKALNYILPKGFQIPVNGKGMNPANIPFTEINARMIERFIMPVQLERITHDISLWREAVQAAENAWYPTRMKMQRMFVDSILEGHTLSCMNRRKDLSRLKDFIIVDQNDNIQEEATKIFKDQKWFDNLINYILDAQFFGYTLIQLGDLKMQGKKFDFPQLNNVRRWNVEPDRQNVVSIMGQKSGINFMDPDSKDENGLSYYDYTIYVDTPTDIGHSICGYGLLYNIALYGILLKNNLGNNADYTQNFSTPFRFAKTPAGYGEDKKSAVAEMLSKMGSMGWGLADEGVTVDFHESNSGNGYKGYESLEMRCQKIISKLLLGHSDAVDSTPGKLGAGQGPNEESPAGKALADTEKLQDKFLLQNLTDIALPKFRKLGFPIAEGFKFAVTRDKEELEARKKEDASNQETANIFQTIKNAGGKPDWKYFTERTGIPVEEAVEETPEEKLPASREAIHKKLKNIYR